MPSAASRNRYPNPFCLKAGDLLKSALAIAIGLASTFLAVLMLIRNFGGVAATSASQGNLPPVDFGWPWLAVALVVSGAVSLAVAIHRLTA